MGRTMPSGKAKKRAQALQKEVAIDNTMDPEMRTTLTQERGRRVGFKKVGEATSSATYDSVPTKESVGKKKRKGLLQTFKDAWNGKK